MNRFTIKDFYGAGEGDRSRSTPLDFVNGEPAVLRGNKERANPVEYLRGLLELDDRVSPAYEQIRIRLEIKADCSDDELDALLAYTQDHSPLCNTVCRQYRST